MFKVHENGDGSTSIFCSKTGKLICTIRKQQKNMGLGGRPANVVEPSPKARSFPFNTGTNESKELKAVLDDEKEKDILSEKFDSPAWDEPDEDFYAESITSEDFARCLNLVSTEKFKSQPIDDLKSTFPLRLLPRTKALPDNAKFSEDLPITSSVGLKILQLNKHKNFYCDQTVEMKIKNYENFCRFQINSSYVFNHPNLRCRDKKDYPVYFSSKNSKCATAHNYAFNRRQRLENLITIRTGLNTQSRKLLLSCNRRLAVSIKRLPDDEIKYWMQKRARLGPISADLIKGEDSSLMGSDSDATVIEQNFPAYVDLCSDESSGPSDNDDPPYRCKMPKKSKLQKVLGSSTNKLSPLRNRNGQNRKQFLNYFKISKDSYVTLKNVLHGMWRCGSDYYVSGTNIKVPFLKDYLNSLDSNTRSNLVIPETRLIINQRYDHAYHRPFSTLTDSKRKKFIPNSNCLNHKNSKMKFDFKNKFKGSNYVKTKSFKHDSSDSFKLGVNKTIPDLAVIPIIDLSPPNSPSKKPLNLHWTFHCYGCGHENSHKESDVHSFATQHLKDFHCVLEPNIFLNTSYTSSGVVLEAFPGYKKI